MTQKKIKVILLKSFEFNQSELNGKTQEEKIEEALKIARARLTTAMKNTTTKVLLENRIILI